MVGRRTDRIGKRSGSGSAFLPLAAVVTLGGLMRFYGIGAQSLWVDELWSIKASCIGGGLSPVAVFGNMQGPAHAVLVHAVAHLSDSETVLRSISALFGTATIAVIYALANDLFDRRTALLAALLTAVSPFLIWYSQELRNYSMVIFFAALSTLVTWRLVERKSASWRTFVLATVLGLLSNLSAVFLALGHWVFAVPRLVKDRAFRVRWILAFGVVLVLVSPWIWGLAGWAKTDRVGERIGIVSRRDTSELLRGETTFTPMAIPYSFYVMVFGYSLGPSSVELHTTPPASAFMKHAAYVGPAALVLALVVFLGLRSFSESRARLRLLLPTVLVPVVGTSVLAILNVKVFNPRYIAVALPLILVLIAAGATRLRGLPGTVMAGLLIVLSCWSAGNYYWCPTYWREDVRSAVQYIKERETAGDVVLVPVVTDVFDHYYEGEQERFLLYPGQAGSDAEVAERVTSGVAGHQRLWFVSSRSWHVDPEGRIPASLDSRYDLLDSAHFPGVEVSLYRLGEGTVLSAPEQARR
jgi:4-amino-4-deoxy-L-arabinose transferase-like glycosyltransferase